MVLLLLYTALFFCVGAAAQGKKILRSILHSDSGRQRLAKVVDSLQQIRAVQESTTVVPIQISSGYEEIIKINQQARKRQYRGAVIRIIIGISMLAFLIFSWQYRKRKQAQKK